MLLTNALLKMKRIDFLPLGMQVTEETLNITKTARYFTVGSPEKARYFWIVFHGYGQLARYFINNFTHLDPDEHYVVAPEGLNRFYLEGFSGRIGATWMTRESRLTDIEDYVKYIDAVYERAVLSKKRGAEVIALGFSQGVATVARWVAYGQFTPDRLMLWAGSFPPDLEPAKAEKAFSNLPTLCCIGDSDPFVNEAQIKTTRDHMEALGIRAGWTHYAGGHHIPEKEFLEICKDFIPGF